MFRRQDVAAASYSVRSALSSSSASTSVEAPDFEGRRLRGRSRRINGVDRDPSAASFGWDIMLRIGGRRSGVLEPSPAESVVEERRVSLVASGLRTLSPNRACRPSARCMGFKRGFALRPFGFPLFKGSVATPRSMHSALRNGRGVSSISMPSSRRPRSPSEEVVPSDVSVEVDWLRGPPMDGVVGG